MRDLKRKIVATMLTVSLAIPTPVLADVTSDQSSNKEDNLTTHVTATVDMSFTVTVPKAISVNTATNKEEYTVKAKGNIPSGKKLTCEPQDADPMTTGTNFTMTETKWSTGSCIANVSQLKTRFLASELGYDGNGALKESTTKGCVTIPNTLTSGTWEGDMVFNIALEDYSTPDKCYVVVMDDDGTVYCDDEHTGFTTWCNDQGIPVTFAVDPLGVSKTDYYTLDDLKNLAANGNEIVCHGWDFEDDADNYTAGTLDEKLTKSKKWMQDNGFNASIYVYPNCNYSTNYSAIRDCVGDYFDYACTATVTDSCSLPEYRSELGTTSGFWNTVNSDRLNIARSEIKTTTLSQTWFQDEVDECVNSNGLLVLFTHSFQDDFTKDGGLEAGKNLITTLKGKSNVEFVTLSEALERYYE